MSDIVYKESRQTLLLGAFSYSDIFKDKFSSDRKELQALVKKFGRKNQVARQKGLHILQDDCFVSAFILRVLRGNEIAVPQQVFIECRSIKARSYYGRNIGSSIKVNRIGCNAVHS